ncbi:Di-copper centre-containing protein [Canariomyces notabilis]|uniref:Di-copper centre-containing protein n=1 Tax=Canariomyces notabilis TaxID=2074819 RepID=A0AAN6TD70_9PEZI|nr:Di-copper centre-containing protein [Canariomyces arenarius]
MAWLQIFVVFLLCVCSAVVGEPCTNPAKRRAWHTLSNADKLAYINAELCLMQKPARLGLPGAKTRFDELQAIHQLQAYATHFVGSFLPFHRLMMHAHESALRSECGYTGYQPYWHEQIDAGKFSRSVLLDATYGFGGDGSRTTGCITNGPFVNYTNSLGPGYEVTSHCINRRISDLASMGSSQAQVDACLAMKDFETAWPCIEGQPHSGGHAGVGGQMQNGVSSPGDPLFYLHHTWLDKVFWDWQARDRAVRVSRIAGTNIGPDFAPGFPPRPASIPKPTGADGDPGRVTTMGHVLNMYGNGPNKTIADVMDIQGDFLCYEYVEP